MDIKITNDTGNKLSVERLDAIRDVFKCFIDQFDVPNAPELARMLELAQIRGGWERDYAKRQSTYTAFDYINQGWITVTVME